MKSDHVSCKQLTLVECDPPQAKKSPGGQSEFACVLSGLGGMDIRCSKQNALLRR